MTRARWMVFGFLLLAACGEGGGLSIDSNRGGGHKNFEEVELALADTGVVIAVWNIDEGWQDALGERIGALPPSVLVGETLEPLREGGPPASLHVRFVEPEEIEIAPLEVAEEGNPCGEFSSRYFPRDDETAVIAWPNLPDPDEPAGPGLFAMRGNGELVQLFHCDRLDIYPERAGTAYLQVLLWHVNHADQASDALAVEVEAE